MLPRQVEHHEKCIQYPRELAVLEVIHNIDLVNEQLLQDPHDVKCPFYQVTWKKNDFNGVLSNSKTLDKLKGR